MRGVVTCGGLIVITAIIIMIHATITGNNIRRGEVERGLDSSIDYAFDRLGDIYADEFFTTYSEDRREQIIEELVFDFCSVLENRIASDGEIEVRLISADLETGLFQIGVTEEYTYPFGGMNGKCYYEKAYSFN
ncbi:MAG: hypothetical protein SO361_04320 [Lachnospira sp.]|nr:hypothetical protein [Lachnospira sp.]